VLDAAQISATRRRHTRQHRLISCWQVITICCRVITACRREVIHEDAASSTATRQHVVLPHLLLRRRVISKESRVVFDNGMPSAIFAALRLGRWSVRSCRDEKLWNGRPTRIVVAPRLMLDHRPGRSRRPCRGPRPVRSSRRAAIQDVAATNHVDPTTFRTDLAARREASKLFRIKRQHVVPTRQEFVRTSLLVVARGRCSGRSGNTSCRPAVIL